MEPRNRKDAFKSVVEKFLAEEATTGSTDKYRYANTVVISFEEIQSLRMKGVRFDKICKLLESAGMLAENANVHSLRQAFAREKARRNKIGGHEARETKKRGAEATGIGVQPIEKKTPEPRPYNPNPSGFTVPRRTERREAGIDVQPDNTFTIRPIDPDDLPEILKK